MVPETRLTLHNKRKVSDSLEAFFKLNMAPAIFVRSMLAIDVNLLVTLLSDPGTKSIKSIDFALRFSSSFNNDDIILLHYFCGHEFTLFDHCHA